MKRFSATALAAPALIGALMLTLFAAGPAAAQSRHRDSRNDNTRDVVVGAALGALAGALIGHGDGRYVAGGALAGAAVSAASDPRPQDCAYYRDGRCYRNQGHWEREHGINSRDAYGYRRDPGQDRRDRDYRYDRRW